MSNELVVIEPKNALAFFTEKDQLEEIIKQVEMEVMTFEHDLSNKARRNKTASLARKVASTKTYLDGLGKDLVADWKNKAKVVDANRRMVRDRLDELRDLARKPLTEWEEEQARIEAEEAAKAEAERIAAEIENAHEIAIYMNNEFDREVAERKEEEERQRIEAERIAEQQRKEREEQIRKEAQEEAERKAKEDAERWEREKAEAEARAIQAEKDRIASEEKAKRDAEEAEKRRIEWEKEQERLRIEAEEKAKRDAEEAAERARQEEIKRQQEEKARMEAEAKAREENKRHIGKIRKEAKESLMAFGLDEDQAKQIVLAIHNKQIKNVSINY